MFAIIAIKVTKWNARLVRDKITNSKGKHGYKYGNICGLIHSEFDSRFRANSAFGTIRYSIVRSIRKRRSHSFACLSSLEELSWLMKVFIVLS